MGKIDEANLSNQQELTRDDANLEKFVEQQGEFNKALVRMADDNLQLLQSMASLLDKLSEAQTNFNNLINLLKQ